MCSHGDLAAALTGVLKGVLTAVLTAVLRLCSRPSNYSSCQELMINKHSAYLHVSVTNSTQKLHSTDRSCKSLMKKKHNISKAGGARCRPILSLEIKLAK